MKQWQLPEMKEYLALSLQEKDVSIKPNQIIEGYTFCLPFLVNWVSVWVAMHLGWNKDCSMFIYLN